MSHEITGLIKLNVRVSNLQDALGFFQDVFGAEPLRNRGSNTIGEFDGATMSLGGTTLDFVAPNNPDAALAKSIERRGQGLDSLAFAVENLEDTIAALRAKGIEVINRHEFYGSRIAFVHPRDAFGVMLELIERPASE